eukprot:TRINITY_DN2521_c1_g1_i1.p1 TRINITY_DN2521_c1_g1~~TRINITY_DN2521_c1_g1_i1.p1  ORF type:complete len:812 (+),score=118.71 TRINITY_DN2521_c1_g1_i1:124-2559(+)
MDEDPELKPYLERVYKEYKFPSLWLFARSRDDSPRTRALRQAVRDCHDIDGEPDWKTGSRSVHIPVSTSESTDVDSDSEDDTEDGALYEKCALILARRFGLTRRRAKVGIVQVQEHWGSYTPRLYLYDPSDIPERPKLVRVSTYEDSQEGSDRGSPSPLLDNSGTGNEASSIVIPNGNGNGHVSDTVAVSEGHGDKVVDQDTGTADGEEDAESTASYYSTGTVSYYTTDEDENNDNDNGDDDDDDADHADDGGASTLETARHREAILELLDHFVKGKSDLYLKSDPVPTQPVDEETGVMTVVADSFEDVIFGPQAVLIHLYYNNDGDVDYIRDTAPGAVLQNVAQGLQDCPGIIVAAMDLYSNEPHPTFVQAHSPVPQYRLYSPGASSSFELWDMETHPTPRASQLMRWVHKHGNVAFDINQTLGRLSRDVSSPSLGTGSSPTRARRGHADDNDDDDTAAPALAAAAAAAANNNNNNPDSSGAARDRGGETGTGAASAATSPPSTGAYTSAVRITIPGGKESSPDASNTNGATTMSIAIPGSGGGAQGTNRTPVVAHEAIKVKLSGRARGGGSGSDGAPVPVRMNIPGRSAGGTGSSQSPRLIVETTGRTHRSRYTALLEPRQSMLHGAYRWYRLRGDGCTLIPEDISQTRQGTIEDVGCTIKVEFSRLSGVSMTAETSEPVEPVAEIARQVTSLLNAAEGPRLRVRDLAGNPVTIRLDKKKKDHLVLEREGGLILACGSLLDVRAWGSSRDETYEITVTIPDFYRLLCDNSEHRDIVVYCIRQLADRAIASNKGRPALPKKHKRWAWLCS